MRDSEFATFSLLSLSIKLFYIKEVELVFCKVQFFRHFIFIMRNEAFNAFLDEFYWRGSPRLAIIS